MEIDKSNFTEILIYINLFYIVLVLIFIFYAIKNFNMLKHYIDANNDYNSMRIKDIEKKLNITTKPNLKY
jgi:hypothetical protein